jgi:hypothetical protein
MKVRGTRPVVLKVLLKVSLRVLYPTNTSHESVLIESRVFRPGPRLVSSETTVAIERTPVLRA